MRRAVHVAIVSLAGALCAMVPRASAQGATLELKIQKVQFSRGESFPLELVITASANSPVAGVEIAGLHQFDLQGGPDIAMSVQVDMRRGVSSSVHSYRYQLGAKEVGAFLIGPATASVGGVLTRSNSVAVKVVPGSAQSSQLPGVDPQLFLAATADKTTVFAGEQVIVSYSLYSRINYFGLELRREPKTDGFWIEELEVPRGHGAYTQENINGQIYRVQLLKRQAVFPLRTGKLSIGSMVLDASVGGGFFGGGQKMNRASLPLELHVKPLPANGRPAGFLEPNVGRYNLSGGVDRMQVAMGEAIKYRLHLEGQGNIKNVILPDLGQSQAYRRFDPEPKVTVRVEGQNVVGTRTLEYLLSPSEPGRMIIPSIVFHYFDPSDAQYKTQTVPETVVRVTGQTGLGSQKDPNKNGITPQGPLPGADPDLRGIQQAVTLSGATRFHSGGFFWGLVFAPPLVFLLLLAFGRARALRSELRQKGEPRRRAASAYKRLREAERLLEADDAHRFFGEISRVLTTFLEAKLTEAIGSKTLPELDQTLVARGYPVDVAAGVVKELENCDFGRFAPSDSRREEMRNTLQRARKLLDALDKVKPLQLSDAPAFEASR